MTQRFSLEHIGLAAKDTTALKTWYERTLGAREVFCNGQQPPAYFMELPGGIWIEIYEADFALKEVTDNNLQGWRHLALSVESIEDARRELEARGVAFSQAVKPAGGGGRVLFFQDPEGNLLHLVERTVDSKLKRL
jgi:glyoxylase I family protein